MTRKKPRKQLPTEYKIVKVDWTDAWSEDGWKAIKSLPENKAGAKVKTIGWLVNEDDEFYYIANSVSAQEVACTIIIPKPMVTNYEEISLTTSGA